MLNKEASFLRNRPADRNYPDQRYVLFSQKTGTDEKGRQFLKHPPLIIQLCLSSIIFLLMASSLQAQVLTSGDSTTTDSVPNISSPPTESGNSGKGKLKGNPDDEESVVVKKKRRKEKPVGTLKPKDDEDESSHSPKRAARLSLIVPGGGQLYNGRWWKLPIIYGGFATMTYLFIDNHVKYKAHRDIVICKLDSTCSDSTLYPEFALFDVGSVITIRNFHRRYRDLNIIIGALWYTLNIIDAYVDAHLKEFTVNGDLSARLKPSINFIDPFRQKPQIFMGATLSFRLRR